MKEKLGNQTALMACVAGLFLCPAQTSGAADVSETEKQIQLLQQQNELLQQQLRKQQELIDSLTHKVTQIQEASASRDQKLEELKDEKTEGGSSGTGGGFHFGKVNISGEGALGFFYSQADGQNPNGDFRVDEAKIFIEAPIWNEVYFFSELNLATREERDLDLRLGELYLDFENVSQLWNQDRQLNFRIGRFYIPFGEEYIYRYAIDDPLISHSLSDLWGMDEGIEAYGSFGKFGYAVAVQNGGVDTVHDWDADKAVSGRISYDPNKWLHLSVSGMRTGNLDATEDDEGRSELWFSDGWIRSIGSPATTRFHANLVEGDVQVNTPWVFLRGFGGYINYDDNDPAGNNRRNIYYYSVEGVKNITHKFYGAARYSQVLAPEGFPIVGNAPIGTFFNPTTPLTTDYWRLSLGAGYRFSPNLIVKGEYSFNQGKTVGGGKRNHENVFALQAAYRF